MIATATMPAEDWVKNPCDLLDGESPAFLTSCCKFPHRSRRHQKLNAGYREIFEAFMNIDAETYPLLGEIRDFFLHEARAIQNGGAEYVYSAEWLGIYWPHDEYIFIKMTAEGRLADFYREAGGLLNKVVARGAAGDDVALSWPKRCA